MMKTSPKSPSQSSSSSPFSCTTMLSNHRYHDEQPTLHDQHQGEYRFDHSTLMHESVKYGLKIAIQKRKLVTNKKLNSSSNFDNSIRVCSDCNTTKTPLWRGGPSGPKSLCNACGIRQRKVRRAMAEAASDGPIPATTTTSTYHHVKTAAVVHKKYKKKRCNNKLCVPSSSTSQKLGLEEFMLSLREKYSAFQRVFPQDEKEAAILLMALSHGLVL